METRNPFRMRTSERIESDLSFLRLFGPGVLELLPGDDLWDRVQIFQSAPGGGKTSLFRIFTPSVLLNLHEFRIGSSDSLKELYGKMEKLGVMATKGPNILGIYLSCGNNYAVLEDLNFEQVHKERLLYSLLNSRLTLALLRGALALKKLDYPGDLEKLTINQVGGVMLPPQIPVDCSGLELFEWARDLEKSVCNAIDSFGPPSQDVLEGHDTLYALMLTNPGCITCDGKPISIRSVVMLDDFHKLAAVQRKRLLDSIFVLRPPVGVWIAERLEVLEPVELLDATSGREYGQVVKLEDYWRSGGNSKKFESIVTNIAERRAMSSADVLSGDIQIGSFSQCLAQNLDGVEWQSRFEEAVSVISERVNNRTKDTNLYKDWIRSAEEKSSSAQQQAIEWRSLEIIVEREVKKPQLTLIDDPLPNEEFTNKESSSIRAAAELFLYQEFGFPIYFGISKLALLASSNIEQFLALSAELFEEITASALVKKKPPILTAERQQALLKKVAQQRWDEIPRRIPNGRDVQKLLLAFRDVAQAQTNRPTAPYAPGITGIGITMEERDRLLNLDTSNRKQPYHRVINALSSSISRNLLEVSLDRSQGQKGKKWMLLHLNRWLCVHFDLPLGYGGWRQTTLKELVEWTEVGNSSNTLL